MKFREQRGLFRDSMKTVVELPNNRTALARHLQSILGFTVSPRHVSLEWGFYDERCKWNFYTVSWKGRIVGYTDGPLERVKRGFAVMSAEDRKRIATMGGNKIAKNRKHMANIGRVGGKNSTS